MAKWGVEVAGEDGRLIGWLREAAEHARERELEVRAERSDWPLASIEVGISLHGILTHGMAFDEDCVEQFGTEGYLLKWEEIFEDASVLGGNPLLYAIDEVAKGLLNG